jgi:hypothetical protein
MGLACGSLSQKWRRGFWLSLFLFRGVSRSPHCFSQGLFLYVCCLSNYFSDSSKQINENTKENGDRQKKGETTFCGAPHHYHIMR